MKVFKNHKNLIKLFRCFLVAIFLFTFFGGTFLNFGFNSCAHASDSPNSSIDARYTGNDGWLTPSNARSLLYSQGKIHWVYTGLFENKSRVLSSHSEDDGKTWSKGKSIAPWFDSKNT